MIPLDIDDRAAIRAALRERLDRYTLPYLRRRLRVFGDREYRHMAPEQADRLRRVDVAIFNAAVDRVQRERRLIEAMA